MINLNLTIPLKVKKGRNTVIVTHPMGKEETKFRLYIESNFGPVTLDFPTSYLPKLIKELQDLTKNKIKK